MRIFCVRSYSFDGGRMPNCVNNKLLETEYQATLCKVTLNFQWLSFDCTASAAFIHLHFNKDECIRGKGAKYAFNEWHRRSGTVKSLRFKWEAAKNLVLHMHRIPLHIDCLLCSPKLRMFPGGSSRLHSGGYWGNEGVRMVSSKLFPLQFETPSVLLPDKMKFSLRFL